MIFEGSELREARIQFQHPKTGIASKRQTKHQKTKHKHLATSVIRYNFAAEASSVKPGYVLAIETKNSIQRQAKHPKIRQTPIDKCD